MVDEKLRELELG